MLDGTARIWVEQDRHPGDRLRLFASVSEAFGPRSALYPGSWADIAPSFVIDDVTYVDSDRRAARFFADVDGVDELIERHRSGPGRARWRFIPADYRDELPVAGGSVDLLISLYAGLVFEHCTRYLRPGGLLLANTSHGDASLAALDPRYELTSVVQSEDGGYRLVSHDLDRFLQPKRPEQATVEDLRRTGRGIAYTRTAFAYLFRRRDL